MSYFEFLIIGHLLAVIVWVGGNVMNQFTYLRARAASPERVISFSSDVEWIGQHLLLPSSLLVLVFGVLLVIELPAYEFSQFWISAALAMWVASAVTGAAFLGPESGRIAVMGSERDPADPEVQSRIARIVVISRIELALLVLIVIDMVLKPGL